MCDILEGLLSGIVSGIIATWLFWVYNNKCLKPKIRVSDDIAFKKEMKTIEIINKDGNITKYRQNVVVYRIKILNESKRDAYDINVHIRIRYKNVFATINVPYLPILYGKKNDDLYENERVLPFSLNDIRKARIESFKTESISKKHKERRLEITDFKDSKTLFEIIIFATDSKSGALQSLIRRKLSYDEIKTSLKEGDFPPGKLTVQRGSEEACN